MPKRAWLSHISSLISSATAATAITTVSILSTLLLAVATFHMASQTKEMATATQSMAKETQSLADLSRTEFAIKSFPTLEITNVQLTLEHNSIGNSFDIINQGEIAALQVGVMPIEIYNTHPNNQLEFDSIPLLSTSNDNMSSGIDVSTAITAHAFRKLNTIHDIGNNGIPMYLLIFVRFKVPLMSTYHYDVYGYIRVGAVDGNKSVWNNIPREWRDKLIREYCNYIGGSDHYNFERKFLHDYIQVKMLNMMRKVHDK